MVYRENPINMGDLGVPLSMETTMWLVECKETFVPHVSCEKTRRFFFLFTHVYPEPANA